MPALPGRVADTWVDEGSGGGGGGGTTVHNLLTGRSASNAHPQSAITGLVAALAALIPLSQKAAASGVATLDGGGKIPAAQIPAIALSEFLGTVASEAAMLALVGQRGDWCIRTDLDPDSVFMLESDDPTQAANWTNLTGVGVVSVDGQTGVVSIVTQTITNGVTNRAPSEDAVFDALALKGTATIDDWAALGNLGATETITGIDDHLVRAAGTLDQACTVTIATSADQLIDLQLTQDGTGGRAVTWAGVDVWHTAAGTAPVLTGRAAGAVDRFFFEDIAGTCHGYWLTEDVVGLFDFQLPSGAGGMTNPRGVGALSNIAALSTGRLTLVAARIKAGDVVSSITFRSAVTALSAGSNQWFALFDKDRVQRAISADDTNTAWAASSGKTLAMTAPWTATYTGLVYLGICVVATTVPTLAGTNGSAEVNGIAPILVGNSNTGLTNPASAPSTANALTPVGLLPFAYWS